MAYGEVVRLTQGSPPGLMTKDCHRHYKTKPTRGTRSGEGSEGGRSTGSTDDSGPMKPGNTVEEKTLTTRKRANIKSGCPNCVVGTGEAVDERRQ